MKNLSNLIIELVLALTLAVVAWHGPMPLNPDPVVARVNLTLPAGLCNAIVLYSGSQM